MSGLPYTPPAMRKLTVLAGLLLTLSACGSSGSVSYKLVLDATGREHKSDILLASMHVIESRVAAMSEELVRQDIAPDDEGAVITVELSNPAAVEVLTGGLTSPFTMRLMRETTSEKATLTLEGHGSFEDTGLTGSSISWIRAEEDPSDPNKGRVFISFTPEGQELVKKVFRESKGKNLGLFVRDRLISKVPAAKEPAGDVGIDGIPSIGIARAFADDVNVGLHVTFTPLP